MFFCMFTFGHAQTTDDTLSLTFKDLPLELVLDSITYKTGYYFSYNADILPPGSLYTLDRKRIHIDKLLNELLVGTNLEYTRQEDQIIIRRNLKINDPIPNSGSQQNIQISGWVRDMKTKDPIVGVNVYLNGTTIGAVTDQFGNYSISNVSRDNYVVVFSFVGYELVSYTLKPGSNNYYAVNCLMVDKVFTLEQVEVSSSPFIDESDWPKFYRLFKSQFIGNTSFASRCNILNPEVLNFAFNNDTETYYAYADEPIIMENQALGYIVYFNLINYEANQMDARFHVVARFEELESKSRGLQKRWKKNRIKSYLGSPFHFFKSLASGTLEHEGYSIFLMDKDKLEKRSIKSDEVLKIGANGNKYLSFDEYLAIEYHREYEPIEYREYVNRDNPFYYSGVSTEKIGIRNSNPQSTVLELKSNDIRIYKSGQVQSPENLVYYGYWSWERMAELMPVNYNFRSDKL